MDLNDFYSENEIEAWEVVLGPRMHYHYGVYSEVNDPFDQAIFDLFKYIRPQSTVLDCGCGWGGPGNLIRQELGCDITGVTISEAQAKYIKNFRAINSDLESFVPDKNYDIAVFIESFTHIVNSEELLARLYKKVDSILIKDFVADEPFDVPRWGMKFRTKDRFFDELENAGYEIQDYHETFNFFQPSVDIWLERINQLNPTVVTGHIETLLDLCEYHSKQKSSELRQCNVYAKRLKR